jgi:hypothetical protein
MSNAVFIPIDDQGPVARSTPRRGISLRLPMLRGLGAALASRPF